MRKKKPALHIVGSILIIIAIVLGILVTIVRAVPDLESQLYGFIRYGYPRLTTLRCPMLMTSLDRLPVTIRLKNPLDKNLTWYVNTQLSTPLVMTTDKQTLELSPGETRILTYEVDKNNIDLQIFIFAHVFSSAGSLGMREATCGTFTLPLSFTGGPYIYYSALGAFVLFTVAGLWLWLRHADMSEPSVVSRSWWLRFLIPVLALAIVTSIFGWWLLAFLLLILTMLTLIVGLLR
ncbi:MAG: hypothetical protein ACM3H7_01590 [Acidobacteriaceae bacterium]